MAGKVELAWEDPPPLRKQSHGVTKALEEALVQVRTKPNTWAKLAVWPGESGAYGARKRLIERGFSEWKNNGRFAFEVRKGEDKSSVLYARYEVKTRT